MVRSDNLPRLVEEGRITNPCELAGVCLCDPGGRALRYFATKFLSVTKEVFPPSTEARRLLATGWFACLLEGFALPSAAAADAPGGPDGVDGGGSGGCVQAFAHISLHYLTPF